MIIIFNGVVASLESIQRRGSLDFLIENEAIEKWEHSGKKVKGGNRTYSDFSIMVCLQLRQVFKFPLRQVENLMGSILRLMNLDLPVPDFSTLSRRTSSLNIKLPQYKLSKNTTIMIDSTGLKVYEAGEWAKRKRGYNRHKMWRKLHIVIDGDTQEIIACDLTPNSVNSDYQKLIGDRGYDKWKVYDFLDCKGITPVINVQRNAVKSEKDTPSYKARNNAVESLQDEHQKKKWKKETGYSRRSLVETAFYRYKVTFRDRLLSRKLENQRVETLLNCAILNKMLSVGVTQNETIM